MVRRRAARVRLQVDISQGVASAWDAWLLRLAQDHGVSLIFLHRENPLRRYYSLFDKGQANVGAKLGGLALPTQQIMEELRPTKAEDDLLTAWKKEADRLGVRTLRLTFEGMMADKPAALATISSFILGDDHHRWCPADRATLASGKRAAHAAAGFSFADLATDERKFAVHGSMVLSANVTNWPDVWAALAGTKFEKYLTQDGSVAPSSTFTRAQALAEKDAVIGALKDEVARLQRQAGHRAY